MHKTLRSGLRNLALVSLASLGAAPALADFNTATAALEKKDYPTALAEFSALAELGHADSQYSLGALYYNGHGTARNPLLGYGWIKLAADSGIAGAVTMEKKLRDRFSEQDRAAVLQKLAAYTPEAIQHRLMPQILPNCDYADRSAPKLHPMAPKDIYPFEAVRNGKEGRVDIESLVAPDGHARETRIITAMPPGVFDAAVTKFIREARFDPAIKDGKPDWGLVITTFRFEMREDRFISNAREGKAAHDPAYADADKIVDNLHAEAEAGNPSAQYMYAAVLAGHPRYKVPWSEALPWMTKAATAGMKEAQFQLGQSLLTGRGCKADEKKALEWLGLSAQQGYPGAQMTLAGIMARSRESQAKTLFWLERAAAGADASGRRRLAAYLASPTLSADRDSKRALTMADELLKEDREDPLLFEIRAAAQAGLGAYDKAMADEKTAIKKAQRLRWDTAQMTERLAGYRNGKELVGELMPW